MGVEVYQVVFLLYSVTVVKLFIDFLMLDKVYIPGINPTWSWFGIL